MQKGMTTKTTLLTAASLCVLLSCPSIARAGEQQAATAGQSKTTASHPNQRQQTLSINSAAPTTQSGALSPVSGQPVTPGTMQLPAQKHDAHAAAAGKSDQVSYAVTKMPATNISDGSVSQLLEKARPDIMGDLDHLDAQWDIMETPSL